ncbi:MAG: prepilin-type cleavage/methylation domain-containing protein [Rhodocyclaceae bacterium]|nr:prepilin-type cleavage/methylation domain-containing protein [Rhodocyclaceae bacterium]
MTQITYKRFGQSGVILLETLIAILIFSIGILALVGVQAVMVSNTSDARYRSEASFIVQRRIAAIWTDSAVVMEGDPSDPVNQPGTPIPDLLPGGIRYTMQTAPGEFLVLVTWQPPGDPGNIVVHQHMAIARVAGGA